MLLVKFSKFEYLTEWNVRPMGHMDVKNAADTGFRNAMTVKIVQKMLALHFH